jgi:hypothetical protein
MATVNRRLVKRTLRRAKERIRYPVLRWLFNRRTIALAAKRDHVLCLGDSHTLIFRSVHVPGVWFLPHRIGGATASGILNPINKSESYRIINRQLAATPRWQQVLLLLGEVDCNYLIWHRARRLQLSIGEQLTTTLDAYATFIERVINEGFSRVFVLSVPPPTIDEYPRANLSNAALLRSKIDVSIHDRTVLTMDFNAELERRCETMGAVFIDATTRAIDPETGLVKRRFVRDNPRDHHLTKESYAELVSEQFELVRDRGPAEAAR